MSLGIGSGVGVDFGVGVEISLSRGLGLVVIIVRFAMITSCVENSGIIHRLSSQNMFLRGIAVAPVRGRACVANRSDGSSSSNRSITLI